MEIEDNADDGLAEAERDDKIADLEPDADDTESVKGGSVSNVLKTRHDTAKNAISNVR